MRKLLVVTTLIQMSLWAQTGTIQDTTKAAVVTETPLDSTETLSEKLKTLFTQLRTDSTSAVLYFQIAQEYIVVNRRQYALTFMEKSLQKDATNMDVMYAKAELLYNLGRKKSAMSAYLTVLRDFKGSAYLDRIGPKFASSYKITQITNNKFNDVLPAFSPDGKTLVFQSDRKGNWDIYTMILDQGEKSLKQLTDDVESDENASYSPDGKNIVFTSTRDDKSGKKYKPREVYVMDKAGKKPFRVTSSFGSDNWSPVFVDTTTIVFASDRSDNSGGPFWKKNSSIFTIERKGEFLFKMVSKENTNYTDPAVRTQSSQFMYAEKVDDNPFELLISTADPKDKPVNVSNSPGNDLQPHISRNGSFVTFVTDRDGNYEVYKMQVDGQDALRITNDDADDVFPKFSPDASKVVFCSNRTGNYQLFLASTEEGASTNVQLVIATIEKKMATAVDN